MITSRLGPRKVDAGEIMKKLRMIKDECELESMRKATRLADLGADIARKLLRPGKQATDIVREIERQLKAEGAQAVGTSLATGVDTALPHAGTSTREIAEGDVVGWTYRAWAVLGDISGLMP